MSEAVERLELSETLERNALLLPIAYSLMPALIKRLERTPDSQGTNLGLRRKEKKLRFVSRNNGYSPRCQRCARDEQESVVASKVRISCYGCRGWPARS